MAAKPKRVLIRFNGPTEFLHDVEADIVVARGEACEVAPKVADRLKNDPLIDVDIEEPSE